MFSRYCNYENHEIKNESYALIYIFDKAHKYFPRGALVIFEKKFFDCYIF